MKQNNPCYLFGMYEPNTDSVIINAIMIHILAHLLLSVVKNAIQRSHLIHPMILRICTDWHRRILCCMLNWLASLMGYRIMWTL